MKHDARFWDGIAEKYFRRPVADPDAYREKLRLTRAHLRPGMRMMEFGCGTGTTALHHAPHVAHVDAFDISPAMLAIGERQAADQGIANVTFRPADVAGLDLPAESYDAILGMSILHLIEDPAATVRDVHRWLKPGGIFVTSTVCLGDGMTWLKLVLPLGRALGKVPFVQFLKADEIRKMMTQAGFAIETDWRPNGGRTLFLICRKA